MTGRLPSTPFLAVDLPVLQANIDATAAWADDRGIALRPHVKTHKSSEIARMQADAGVARLSVATVGEGEVFAQGGFDELFIAYPLWIDAARGKRLRRLASEVVVTVGFDSLAGARTLVGTGVRGLVEIDSGHHRSGVAPAEAGALAGLAAEAGLEVAGVFTFPGHSYSPTSRLQAAVDEGAALTTAAQSMRAAGVEPGVISGGSTPSLAGLADGVTEARPGVYVFNDAQQWELQVCTPEQIALTCHATVVSHAGGRLVLDAGSKVLGADRPAWASGFGRLLDHPDARIVILSEHHAVVDMAGEQLPPLGSTVRVVPNHACNAVNLVEEYAVLDGGRLVDRWAVSARGMNA
ncbi:MAG: alanine racemase [Propioniciclava sp.]|uniref:alanine racemase n=1 Tax=Propioniciclava sp. TaxID=2038686 RepID=UPI0039E2F406